MKSTHLFAAAFTLFFTACDVKVNTPPAERTVEKHTTIVNPPAKETKETKEKTTTTTEPGGTVTKEKSTTTESK